MRRISTLLFVLVLLLPNGTLAQQADPPKRDFSVTSGLFVGQPEADEPSYYGDSWYHSARLGFSLGRYWTPHFKTELELMTSGEGMRYSQRTSALPDGTTWPYGVQEYYRVSQGSARGVWQLLDNRWIHPYLLAGVSLDAERQHASTTEQYRYIGDGRTPASRQLLVPQQTEGPDTVYRVGAMVGAGAKLYLTTNMFANTAVLVTHGKSAQAVSLILGFGLDF